MSHVTITDPHHFLFGHRLEVLKERSGRGPAYVVVALPDGRRAVRIASTDLAETTITSRPNAADLPRISARTLIPLMQHLSASLRLLDEKVIRDDPPTTSSRSRCVSTPADVGKSTRPSNSRHSAPLAESVDHDANPDCSNNRRADAANARDPRHARKGTGSC
ncbi:hypothetical protein [Bradyrhizobium sp. Cp5.3]|uniref:hypothetical protein n=1 Tax=Bradyrhizobium sp. Cp5.3 TaxID=443598 RepID=UPI0018DBBCCD|nr:hypothetical protein [Bradyrhizobium sp. Cp5.3]